MHAQVGRFMAAVNTNSKEKHSAWEEKATRAAQEQFSLPNISENSPGRQRAWAQTASLPVAPGKLETKWCKLLSVSWCKSHQIHLISRGICGIWRKAGMPNLLPEMTSWLWRRAFLWETAEPNHKNPMATAVPRSNSALCFTLCWTPTLGF